jgi:hypothetical protein
MPTTASATKVVTGKVRLSFAHLFEPYSPDPDQEAKYSVMLLIPKTDKATIKAIKDAQQAALEAGKTSRFGGSIPKNWKNTFRDADEEMDTEERPEMKGMMFMTVSSKTRPGIVDRDVRPILDSTEIYSGCYARVSINAFAFAVQGSKGVSFGLNHVQKLADGDYLGGRSKAEDDFEPAGDDEDGDDLL